MSINLDFNSLNVEKIGRTVNVPNNDLARLMYYLNCVASVIQYDEDNKLTDYQNYHMLTKKEEDVVYGLAALFNPKIFMNAGVFILDDRLVPNNSSNQFYKITDDRIGIKVNQEIVIGGRVIRVLEVMAFKEEWINRNYYEPFERICYKLESERKKKCCSNCNWKKIISWLLSLLIIYVFGTIISQFK